MPNVNQKTSIILLSEPKQENIHHIRILIFGRLNGSATIGTEFQNQGVQVRKVIRNKVRLSIMEDCASKQYILIYKPIDVKSGTLYIRYEFKP